MARFDHHAHALGVDRLHHHLGDLLGEALLKLEPARKHIHQSRELAYTEDTAVGDIADMAAAEKREHVMLAEAIELDVLHDHHAAGGLGKERVIDHLLARHP